MLFCVKSQEDLMQIKKTVASHRCVARITLGRYQSHKPSCVFVSRVSSGGIPIARPTCWYLWRSPLVVAPLHELPGGGLLRGAGPLIQYYTEQKQDCSTS